MKKTHGEVLLGKVVGWLKVTLLHLCFSRFLNFTFATRSRKASHTGWPTKMSLFFFGNNLYKNRQTFKIFSPQLPENYRIILVETTLESMFYYTFSAIISMFVPCTALLYDSTAATQTLKLSTTLLSISCESVWFIFWCPLLSVDCFHRHWLSGTPSENSQAGWDLGDRMTGVIGFTPVPWEVIPEVFKCSVWFEKEGHFCWPPCIFTYCAGNLSVTLSNPLLTNVALI